MRLLAVSDIFGRTRHLENLVECLTSTYECTDLLDPYGGARLDFRNEQEAYAYFQVNIGLAKYRDILLGYLQNTEHTEFHLLGFSIGASAIWLVSEMLNFHENTRATCFYSSQIRNFLKVQPRLKIDLYFPENEPAFEVNTIMKKLLRTPNLQCHQTDYHHGFMNKLSVNYHKEAYHRYIQILKN
ncbi:hypothetical protein [Desulfopila sp. IMCC35008]|uniref:hypothetical protein n=1 Tax=Desulfopila sp. IMCC35008 TaxID=2653858 RepID=UPI0013D53378|nr:hypothetical protein [Desulfopila sp. IMCC35008]